MASLVAVAGQGQFLSLHQKISSQIPEKPSKTRPSKTSLFSIKNLGIGAAAGALIHVAYKNRSLIGLGGGGGGGGAGGVLGGGGGGGGGGWTRLLYQYREWHDHGLPADVVVQISKLNGFKMYKVSAIQIVDLKHYDDVVVGCEDSISEMVSLRSGGIYTKVQLQKELETLATCGLFEKFYLEAKTNHDGTIDLTVSFMKSTSAHQTEDAVNIKEEKPSSKIDFLSVFPYIEVNEGGSIFKIKLKEPENNLAVCGSIDPGRGGFPTWPLIPPGGTVSFEHRNINASLIGTVTTSNLVRPQDDNAFNLEYVNPCLDGVSNSQNRTFSASCFKSRKLSPVFTNGSSVAVAVAPTWVDRFGYKTSVTENLTPIKKFTYGIVWEEITTRDRSNHISSKGQRVVLDGGVSADGPPTTLSGTGIDHLVTAQVNITSDSTKLVNGQIVGNRNVLQMDQGLGFCTKLPTFHRYHITMTKFIQLKEVENGAGKAPPPVLILKSHCGGCVGYLPNYNAFTLGGPYSVRGYKLGEIGAAKYVLELAAEIRVPVRNAQLYGFAEHGNDLGSSGDMMGNPNKVYGQSGCGSSFGVGAKLGLLSAEYAFKHNSGTGAIFFGYGERF